MKTVVGVQMDKALSEALGVSKSFVSVIKNRGTIPYEECVALALERHISLDWLILGRGRQELGELPVAPPGLVEVPQLSATSWPDVDDRTPSWFVPSQWMEHEGLVAGDVVAVRVVGDAMDTTLVEGQVVMVNVEGSTADGVFLVRFGSSVRFRRIQHMANGALRLSCDNPAYAAEIVPADQLEIIGHCHSVLRAVL